MRIAVMQPTYLPWIGYFELIANSEMFVFFDDVQFNMRSWHRRNRIKSDRGETLLTVPVRCDTKNLPLIKDVEINNAVNWKARHLSVILEQYRTSPYLKRYKAGLEDLYDQEYTKLVDLNISVIQWFQNNLGIKTPVIRASNLNISGDRNERLVNVCKELKADELYDAAGAKEILDVSVFVNNGINLRFQQYAHPVYRQIHGDFISHLSVLDLLLNEGDQSLDIILSGRKETLCKN